MKIAITVFDELGQILETRHLRQVTPQDRGTATRIKFQDVEVAEGRVVSEGREYEPETTAHLMFIDQDIDLGEDQVHHPERATMNPDN